MAMAPGRAASMRCAYAAPRIDARMLRAACVQAAILRSLDRRHRMHHHRAALRLCRRGLLRDAGRRRHRAAPGGPLQPGRAAAAAGVLRHGHARLPHALRRRRLPGMRAPSSSRGVCVQADAWGASSCQGAVERAGALSLDVLQLAGSRSEALMTGPRHGKQRIIMRYCQKPSLGGASHGWLTSRVR